MPGPNQGIYNNLWSLLTEPVFKGVISGVLKEHRQPPRPRNLEDESVASFVERRIGADVANNLVSAVLHGIYGGDIHKLSARSVLSGQWDAEGVYGSLSAKIWAAFSKKASLFSAKDAEFSSAILPNIPMELLNALSTASVFTFQGGMETLAKALEKDLRSRSNVHISLDKRIKKIEYDGQQDRVKVFYPSENTSQALTITHLDQFSNQPSCETIHHSNFYLISEQSCEDLCCSTAISG
jgi:oxygen-dependent protoporphyrinogen oxidase